MRIHISRVHVRCLYAVSDFIKAFDAVVLGVCCGPQIKPLRVERERATDRPLYCVTADSF